MVEMLLAVDIGTTGAKSRIMDAAGKIVATSYREYGCTYPRPGWVEQDAEMLIEAAFEATAETTRKAGAAAAEIAAVSFSTQRTCSIFLDAKGKLVRPMISWQDNRPVDEVAAIEKRMGRERYHRITGLPLNTTWNLGKILWLRNNEPDHWARTAKFCQLQDFVLKRFGSGEFYTDSGAAALSGMWDIRKFAWSDEILDAFALDRALLPTVMLPGTRVGAIGSEVSARTGIPAGAAIVVGAGDQHAAMVGAGVTEKGKMSVSLGTGGLVGAFLDSCPDSPDTSANILNHSIKGHYQLEGYQAGAAGVFTWFVEQITRLESAYAQSAGLNPYQLLDSLASGVPAGAKGLMFLPYLASSCAPRWNPDARGAFLGLTFAHDHACMVRAVLEGITLEVRDILESMYRFGADADLIRILGGATKSALWNQLQADVYNRPVQTLAIPDAAVTGAAVYAGVGAGVYRDIPAGVAALVKAGRIYEPRPEAAAVYQELYGLYCLAYAGLSREFFPALAAFQRKTKV